MPDMRSNHLQGSALCVELPRDLILVAIARLLFRTTRGLVLQPDEAALYAVPPRRPRARRWHIAVRALSHVRVIPSAQHAQAAA